MIILNERIVIFLEYKDIFLFEEKVSKKESYVCKNQPFIVKMIMGEKEKNRV